MKNNSKQLNNAKTPTTSILIPVYNREKYIGESIESALHQTIADIEIVIVDNASTDSTWDICKHYSTIDSRVKIFRNDENLGPVRNWLRCISESKGEYGKILFSDDLMFPHFLEHTVPFLKDPDVAFVSTAVLFGKTEYEGVPHFCDFGDEIFSCEQYFEKMIDENTPRSPGSALFRMSDIRANLRSSFPTKIQHDFSKNGAGPDVLLFALTALDYKNVALIPNVDALFRIHSDSFTISNSNDEVSQNYNAAIAWFCRTKLSNTLWARHIARVWLSAVRKKGSFISPYRLCAMYEGVGVNGELLIILFQLYSLIFSGMKIKFKSVFFK